MLAATVANVEVEVYRSSRHELMYVYLQAAAEAEKENENENDPSGSADLSVLPEVLLQRFGEPEFSFAFALTADRQLAAADTAVVLKAIEDQGFYLQMPPTLTVGETPDARNPHES